MNKEQVPTTNSIDEQPPVPQGAASPAVSHAAGADEARGGGESPAAAPPAGAPLHRAKFRDRAGAPPARPAPSAPAGGAGLGFLGTRQGRGIAAAVVAVVIVVIVVVQLALNQSNTAAPTTATSGPASAGGSSKSGASSFAPQSGAALVLAPVIASGGQGHLVDPHETVVGPGHLLYVEDPGAQAVFVYTRHGTFVRAITRGNVAFQQPSAIAANADRLYVLDAKVGRVFAFVGPHNTFAGSFGTSFTAGLGRGMAVDKAGNVYVANPASNTISEFSPSGKELRRQGSPLGSGLGQFNQPSAISVGPDGNVFIVDNANQRIEELSPALAGVATWPAPGSDTFHSVHVLALRPGQLIVSDTRNGLVTYDLSTNPAVLTRRPLAGAGNMGALGVAPLDATHLLVTDYTGRAVWSVPVPAAGS